MRNSLRTTSRHSRALVCWLVALLLCVQSNCSGARDPEAMYTMECQGCHLADGAGGLDNIPTLKDSVANFPAVAGGREYLVQVPGVALSSLSDQDLTDVLNWILRTFGPLRSASLYAPYTVHEVAILRKQPLTEIASKRADLLLLMAQSKVIPAP